MLGSEGVLTCPLWCRKCYSLDRAPYRDGGLGVSRDGLLNGVVVEIDSSFEGVGAVKNQANETAHSVLQKVSTPLVAEHVSCGGCSLSCLVINLVDQCLSKVAETRACLICGLRVDLSPE